MRDTKIKTTMMLTVAAASMLGCGSDTVAPGTYVSDPLWTVGLNVQAVVISTVAPYNTVQITLAPRTASGEPAAAVGAPSFLPSDENVRVSATGLVTGLHPTPRSFVLVQLRDTLTNIVRSDTVFVRVTENQSPPSLATFSIQLPAGDSAKLAAGLPFEYTKTFVPTAADANGDFISDSVLVHYSSSNPNLFVINPHTGLAYGIVPESVVTVRATTTYYGITKTDSVRLTLGYPLSFEAAPYELGSLTPAGAPRLGFSPDTIRIGVGGTVRFQGIPRASFDIVFDDPTVGDITPLERPANPNDIIRVCFLEGGHCFEVKTFTTPGTYGFHSPISGAHGAVVVR